MSTTLYQVYKITSKFIMEKELSLLDNLVKNNYITLTTFYDLLGLPYDINEKKEVLIINDKFINKYQYVNELLFKLINQGKAQLEKNKYLDDVRRGLIRLIKDLNNSYKYDYINEQILLTKKPLKSLI